MSYDNLCKSAFLEHLQGLQGPVGTMVHATRRTLAEEQGLFAQIKIGDWVEVEPEPDYSPSMCSDGGVGCVLGLHTEPGSDIATTISAVDVHFLVFNTKERRVLIPIPYKMHKPTWRVRKILPVQKQLYKKLHITKLHWNGLSTGWKRDAMKRQAGCGSYLKSIIFSLRITNRIMTDYHCQLAYLEGLQHELGDAYKDPREYTGVRSSDSGGKYASMKKSTQFLTLCGPIMFLSVRSKEN